MKSDRYALKYHQFNENSILVEWPKEISQDILEDLTHFKSKIEKSESSPYIDQAVSAYQSLLVQYKATIMCFEQYVIQLQSIYSRETPIKKRKNRNWKIPVCYDAHFALDLAELCEKLKLSKKEVIQRHCMPRYTLFFIGFLPGFLYLGGLDKQLAFPRKLIPRPHVSAGAVCIGGQQTGIYPMDSPGGWTIIGNSPVQLFKSNHKKPCFAEPGDTLQFYPIDAHKHAELAASEPNAFLTQQI